MAKKNPIAAAAKKMAAAPVSNSTVEVKAAETKTVKAEAPKAEAKKAEEPKKETAKKAPAKRTTAKDINLCFKTVYCIFENTIQESIKSRVVCILTCPLPIIRRIRTACSGNLTSH